MKRALVLALLASGCGSTGGQLLSLPFAVGGAAGDGGAPLVFTTALGWHVQLDAALAALGPFYFNIQPPPTDAFRGGVVILQATAQVVVDCLNPALQPVDGGADGETGHAVSVEIGLYTTANGYNDTIALPPPLAAAGQDGTAYVAGSATRGNVRIPFAGRAIVDQSLVTATTFIDDLARVRGAVCDLNFAAPGPSPGGVQLRVDPTHWFDQADFCSLVPASDAGRCHPPDGGAAYGWAAGDVFNRELLDGLDNAQSVYTFSQSP